MLSVAFFWHMHQPYYRDPLNNEYTLPWVRLHACRGYYDMASLLREYPHMRQTFNLVPSLLRQIEEYNQDQVKDVFLEHTRKPAADLTPEEKKFILANFFMGHWETMIKPYPAYWALLEKRGKQIHPARLEDIWPRFTTQDFRDLQVWFNLTWFGYRARKEKVVLRELLHKGRLFSEEDKISLLKVQKEIIQEIIPLYQSLEEQGQIEITTSPFYHPILPLLIDWSLAHRCTPGVVLPSSFAHPEDAEAQIIKAVNYHQQIFGHPPYGLWPSEGSVCPELIPIIKKAGLHWSASDESILFKSFNSNIPRTFLYQPYRFEFQAAEIILLFRDRNLSDLIGFTYAKNEPHAAASDLIYHLLNIRHSLPKEGHLVLIALDGENPWEYYPDSGREFLSRLYESFAKEPSLLPVRINDFLQEHPPNTPLPSLYTGSWINHNFKIWIGSPEDIQAWDSLRRTRNFLVEKEKKGEMKEEIQQSAWEEIYIAEGSDWFWWYGEEFHSEHKEEFDRLFRSHLMQIYLLLNSPIPEYLKHPISLPQEVKPPLEPVGLLSPILDGHVTHFYEWAEAGYFAAQPLRSSMFQGQRFISGFYYGFDLENLYFRIDPPTVQAEVAKDLVVNIIFLTPRESRITFPLVFKGTNQFYYLTISKENREEVRQSVTRLCANQIIELAVPFALLGFKAKEKVNFCLQIQSKDVILERFPRQGYLSFVVPDQEFLISMWQV